MLGVAVLGRAVRQEGAVPIGPQPRVQGLDPRLGAGAHDRALAALDRLLQHLGQRRFQRRVGQVIEANFGHGI